jgi:hypothetical protein
LGLSHAPVFFERRGAKTIQQCRKGPAGGERKGQATVVKKPLYYWAWIGYLHRRVSQEIEEVL